MSGPVPASRHKDVQLVENQSQVIQTLFRSLPKVDLHVHLDGSLFPDMIASLAARSNRRLPTDAAHLREYLLSTKTSSPHQTPGRNWGAFDFCNEFLQTAESLSSATRRVFEYMAEVHNVRVLEIRFCPSLHTNGALSEDDAVRAVTNAMTSYIAERNDQLRGGVILCVLRSMGVEHAREIFQLAERWLGRGVIGADVAGDEGRFPLHAFRAALREAHSAGVPLTVHAGEWVAGGVDDLKLAVEIGARRIGHGLVLGKEKELRELVRDRGVYVETCITSNCAHPDRVSGGEYEMHPVRCMIRDGVRVAGFNCDNLLLSGTVEDRPDPTAEISRAVLRCGLTLSEVRDVLVNGIRGSFAIGDTERDRVFVKQFVHDVDEEIAKFTRLHGHLS